MLAHVADNVAVAATRSAPRPRWSIGHDWGSADRDGVRAAAARPVHRGRAARRPVHAARAEPPAFPPDFYVGHFQTPGVARPRSRPTSASWLRRFYAALTDGTPGWFGVPMHLPDAPLPAWVEDFDAIVATFERNGFAGPLNRYRNFRRDWEDLAAFDELRGARRSSSPASATAPGCGWAPRGRPRSIPDCGHWVQQERPDEVNALLLDWLAATGSSSTA